MRTEKQAAIQLRIAGRSYSEIKQQLGVSKSTLSFWLKDIRLSTQANKRLATRARAGTAALIQRNKNQTIVAKQRSEYIKKQAISEFEKQLNKEIFLLGVALYW